MKYLLILISVLSLACAKKNDDVKEQKHLLIIGDELLNSYTPYLKTNLTPFFDSIKEVENARGTIYTKQNIEKWINENLETNYVVWNNGRWDSIISDENRNEPLFADGSHHYTNLSDYEKNITEIATFLKSKKIEVIFLTTTEIEESQYETNGEVFRNDIAKRVLSTLSVTVIDQYELSTLLSRADGINFGETQYKILGNRVSEQISKRYNLK